MSYTTVLIQMIREAQRERARRAGEAYFPIREDDLECIATTIAHSLERSVPPSDGRPRYFRLVAASCECGGAKAWVEVINGVEHMWGCICHYPLPREAEIIPN